MDLTFYREEKVKSITCAILNAFSVEWLWLVCLWESDVCRLSMLMPPWLWLFLDCHCACPQVPVLQEPLRSALYIQLLLLDPWSTETISPQDPVYHRAEPGPKTRWLIGIWGNFAPASWQRSFQTCIPCRLRDNGRSPCVPHEIKWRAWKSEGDSTHTLCN